MSDRWSQAVVRNVEIDEGATDKDSGGMDLLIECVLAVDQQDAQVLPREQPCALEPGESRADDGHVIIAHMFKALCLTKLEARLRLVLGFRQVLYIAKIVREEMIYLSRLSS